jgi:hypothetical protein
MEKPWPRQSAGVTWQEWATRRGLQQVVDLLVKYAENGALPEQA